MWSLARQVTRNLQVTASGRFTESVRGAELDGLVFAFRARLFAVGVVFAWLLLAIAWPRNAWYAGLALVFFAFGYLPYRLCHHRWAESIKLGFVLLDVCLVTTAILMPPPGDLSIDWPIQTRLRGQAFLFLLLLLSEAALTYSPRRVLWTGASIMTVWTAGFAIINYLPNTLRYTEVIARPNLTDADTLRMFVDPTYVSPASWSTQLVSTALFTLLTVLAVLRSRRQLIAEAKSTIVRGDLARYMSPDVAQAVTDQAASGFGTPSTRNVAVLFADMVGFTGFSEELPPERTFALLRSFQERSSRIVLEHRGTLDKYLGDGVMATFGALQDEPDAPARAISAASALAAEIDRWNAKRSSRRAVPLRIAIGVHYGPVMVGNLGSPHRVEFTVVGDVVNVASRLEKANRLLDAQIVVSAACVRAAGARPESFDDTIALDLRGRAGPLRVCVVRKASTRHAIMVRSMGETWTGYR